MFTHYINIFKNQINGTNHREGLQILNSSLDYEHNPQIHLNQHGHLVGNDALSKNALCLKAYTASDFQYAITNT